MASQLNLDDVFVNALLSQFKLKERVSVSGSGQLHIRSSLNFEVSGKLLEGTQRVRLTLHSGAMKATLLHILLRSAPAEIRAAVQFVSWSKADVCLERLPPLKHFLEHGVLLGLSIPGQNGAALSVDFQMKE